MPSTSNSGFLPDIIDPAVRQQLLRNSDGPFTWDSFHALKRQYGIMYHDQPEGGPALIGLSMPPLFTPVIVRPGPTTDPEALIIALLKAIAATPTAFPTIEAVENDLMALGVRVRGVGQGMMDDISECRAFTAKLRRCSVLEPLEATFYPQALMEAAAKYASLYVLDIYSTADGRYLNIADHRATCGMAFPFPPPEHEARARLALIDAIQRKITLKVLAPVIANGGPYRPPIWRIMDQPLPPPKPEPPLNFPTPPPAIAA